MTLIQDTDLIINLHAEFDVIPVQNQVFWQKLDLFSIQDFKLPIFPSLNSAAKPCSLVIQLNSNNPRHLNESILYVFLNSHKIGMIEGNTQRSFLGKIDSIPLTYFVPGENILSIVRKPGSSEDDELYLDWVELNYSAAPVDTFQIEANDAVGDVYNKTMVGQSFRSLYNNLASIQVMFVPGKNKANQTFRLELVEKDYPEKIIRWVNVPGNEINSYRFSTFSFPPVKNSKGKSYIFYISKTEENGDEPYTILRSSYNSYPDGERYISSSTFNDDLRFICYSE
ncbi:MAG: hypothetical protein A2161_08755 [Candidatus Schekmanbacteria bacterium RBG_13_48_7]|uniref:Uncharacterized protein n=1 Tax=Candidatus Schekmanbacteria bacterium RBG_13_48_7 TaxID=1817878 RepID=A0A1F7S6W6_9BACT|nr:MAG: hypothetical protein A2161_08755 [Candidatus Schekmanbacteria bacterium RBG_13_48_7]